VLTVQGFTALLLPRRMFLRLSAILQLGAFGLFLAVYFLTPNLRTLAEFDSPANHSLVAWCPSYWFFAFFNQLNGSLPHELEWLAVRAWIGLAVVLCGATVSLLLCYTRTMKKTVEEPDLVPGAGGMHRAPRFGSALQTAIVLFSFRSLTRSRQHRVILAFFLSVVFAIALSLLRSELTSPSRLPVNQDFIFPNILMMTFAIIGLRCVFSLPISLTANWVLRTTQLCSSDKYVAATRRTLLVLCVLPVLIMTALLSLTFRPWTQVAGHLFLLALIGCIFTEISLIGFYKVPFTCSYLPGKSNIQYAFWGVGIILPVLAISFAPFEQQALNNPVRFAWLAALLAAATLGLWTFNRHQAKSAVLYFEELPPEIITTLGLISPRPSGSE
jgi:UDP-N-acetylmuramyl pentapeptide phosphotransferase/UDP-N-acetylglucosamine-1-phosphate transferase